MSLPLKINRLSIAAVSIIATAAIILGAFWGGSRWKTAQQKAIIENHAIWIARYWEEGHTVGQISDELARERGVKILLVEWELGDGDEVILGPTVDGKRVCIKRDRSVFWRPAK